MFPPAAAPPHRGEARRPRHDRPQADLDRPFSPTGAEQVLALQRQAGNRAVQRQFIQREDGPGGFQLRPPAGRFRLLDEGLHLDPELQARFRAQQWLEELLDPGRLRPALLTLSPDFLDTPAETGRRILSAPTLPAPGPLVPAGRGPATPRAAGAGDVLRAVLALPAVDTALTNLRARALEQVERDYGRLSTGERVATISAVALIGSGALAGVLLDDEARAFALGQLNGRVISIPGFPALGVELNTERDNVMLGLHLDVGRLLPARLGFGPSSPTPIGGPPGR